MCLQHHGEMGAGKTLPWGTSLEWSVALRSVIVLKLDCGFRNGSHRQLSDNVTDIVHYLGYRAIKVRTLLSNAYTGRHDHCLVIRLKVSLHGVQVTANILLTARFSKGCMNVVCSSFAHAQCSICTNRCRR
jgi:hypothetical protein